MDKTGNDRLATMTDLRPIVNMLRSVRERGWSCPDDERLAAYVDQNLSRPQRVRVERHMSGCRSCRDKMGFLIKAQSFESPEAAPLDWLARVRGLTHSGSSPSIAHRWYWSGAVAAAACAVLAVGLWIKPSARVSAPAPLSSRPVARSTEVIARSEGVNPVGRAARDSVARTQAQIDLSPHIVFPKPDSAVARYGLEFRWKETKGALYYEARLLSSEGDVLWEQKGDALSAPLPATVILRPHETYFLWVRAYLAEGKVVQSKATRFTVAERN
jgi:putative zinc finger protein